MSQFALSRRALLAGSAVAATLPSLPVAAQAGQIRLGAILSASGGLAAFVPPIRAGIMLAIEEINAAGGVLDGQRLALAEADDQTNPQVGVQVATRLVQADNVPLIIGPMASGITIAVANAVTIPAGVPIISPSATAPAVSDLNDSDTVFRTAVPDGLQGAVLGRITRARGIERAAVIAINNDYGRGLAGAFQRGFERHGGSITAVQNFEADRPSYRAELQTLAGRGNPQALVVIAYPGSGGITILRNAIENAFFNRFILTDGMRDQSVVQAVGAQQMEGTFGTAPGSAATPERRAAYEAAFRRANPNLDPAAAFVAQAYDAVYVAALAIQRAGRADRAAIRAALREVANPPGEVVGPGEWARARQLLAAGTAIDYEGASGPVNFNDTGDAEGKIEVWAVREGRIATVETVAS
ncbi:MAG: ABC transporter substrate-binding protein [Acetobacteraceae bacterium]